MHLVYLDRGLGWRQGLSNGSGKKGVLDGGSVGTKKYISFFACILSILCMVLKT